MNIQMVDLKGQYNNIKSKIDNAIQEVIDSAAFINGPKVHEFADNLSKYMGGAYVIPCANGTDALQIALMALDLKPGDEVIVPVHTYVATAEVIALLQLKPVFVDVDPDYFTIDVHQIEKKITNKTKAIVPVHLYGQCADMETIIDVANKYSLYIVEDTAQAIGTEYTFSDGTIKKAGTIGTIGTTSFFPSKNLGCYGDGGALFVSDEELAKKCKMIANHGQSKKYHHDIVGCNSRLDTIQAAILNEKLKHLDGYNKSRFDAALVYKDLLQNVKGVKIPKLYEKSTHVFHQYTVTLERGVNRDALQSFLKDNGIPSMIYYPVPLHKQIAYRDITNESYPITEDLSETVLSLPIHTELTRQEQEFIVSSIVKFIGE